MKSVTPPLAYPTVDTPKGEGMSPGSAAVVGALAGAAVGMGAMTLGKLREAKVDKAAAEEGLGEE